MNRRELFKGLLAVPLGIVATKLMLSERDRKHTNSRNSPPRRYWEGTDIPYEDVIWIHPFDFHLLAEGSSEPNLVEYRASNLPPYLIFFGGAYYHRSTTVEPSAKAKAYFV